LVLIPDASTDANGRPTQGIRRVQIGEDGKAKALDTIEVRGRGMPVRSVSAL
jgi:hypothetical protein